jgi:hypothetical protein
MPEIIFLYHSIRITDYVFFKIQSLRNTAHGICNLKYTGIAQGTLRLVVFPG